MKILLITATYYPSANGVAVAVKNLFEELKRQGHETYLLAPKFGRLVKDEKGVIRYPSAPNPIIKDFPVPLLPLTPEIAKLLKKTNFDIVHAHHPFQISFMADMISSFKDIPFVYTYHTYIDKYIKIYLDFLPKRLVEVIANYTGTGVFAKADLVLVPSPTVEKSIQRFGVRGRVVILPAGVPAFSKPNLSKMALRQKYGLPVKKKILLCVCRIAKEKNITLLVKTIKTLSDDYFLVVVGTGPDLEEMREHVENNNLRSKVTFLGKVDYSKINEPYFLADIFVFPSITETQGIVFLEAAYFGLPIVAVDTAVNREWVGKDFGVVSKNNPSDFKKAILKADLNRDTYSKKAVSFAKAYTLEKTTAALVKEYIKTIRFWIKSQDSDSSLRKRVRVATTYIKKFIFGD